MLFLHVLLFHFQEVGSNSSPLDFGGATATYLQPQNAEEVTLHDFGVSLEELSQRHLGFLESFLFG